MWETIDIGQIIAVLTLAGILYKVARQSVTHEDLKHLEQAIKEKDEESDHGDDQLRGEMNRRFDDVNRQLSEIRGILYKQQ